MENVSRRTALQMGAGAAAALVAGAAASKVAFADEAEEAAEETVVNGTPYTKATNADEIGMIHDAAAEEDFDVVVVGGGMAGFVATMIVAEQAPDATVLLVEANGYYGGGTNFAEQADMPADGATYEEALAYGDEEAAASHYVKDGRLIAERKYDIGRNSAWLFKKHEIPLTIFSNKKLKAALDALEEEGTSISPWTGITVYEGGTGAQTIQRFVSLIGEDEAYANVELRLNTRGSALLVADDKYAITGIQLLNSDGTYTNVNAKAVVLASGGMSNNLELLQYYTSSELDHCVSVDQSHYGDGMVMCEQTAHGRCKTIALSSMMAHVDGLNFTSWLTKAAGTATMTMFVNKDGERFCNEDMTRIETDPSHPGINRCRLIEGQAAVYSIMGSNLLDYYRENGVDGMGFYGTVGDCDLDAELEAAVEAGNENIFVADTVEELADLIGVPQENLVNTVAEYDAACEAGEDTLFGKDPSYLTAIGGAPYYAFKLKSLIVNTNGGVRVDECCRVCDQDHNPVEGLYAAGLIISGFVTELYTTGQCQSVSIWSGSKAARTIVEERLGGTVADDWYGDSEWDGTVDMPVIENWDEYEEYLASLEEE